MTLLKSITVLLVAAIANPMCCCLTLAAPDLEVAANQPSDAHKCCSVTDVERNPSAAQPDGDHDCFHEEIKVSQFNDTVPTATFAPTIGTPFFVGFSEANVSQLPSLYLSLDRHNAGTIKSGQTVSQQYCVYLL